MSNMKSHHELVGEEYNANDEPMRLDRDDPIEHAITLRYLERNVPDGATVVDIGAGSGQYSESLARRGCSVNLVDVSQRLLDTAAARLVAAGLGTWIASIQRGTTGVVCGWWATTIGRQVRTSSPSASVIGTATLAWYVITV